VAAQIGVANHEAVAAAKGARAAIAARLDTMLAHHAVLLMPTVPDVAPPLALPPAETLSVRERGYVQVARLNGLGGLRLVFVEVLPNLLPYIAASFVIAVGQAMLADVRRALLRWSGA
jgi:peptide/nickel transport system permease protein